MNKLRNILLAALLLAASGAAAQPFERLTGRNLWNDGRNVAGIRTDSAALSEAELYVRNLHGTFRDTWEAPQQWSAGAAARTITRWKRISTVGSFSFDHTSGRDMCGSMFLKPGFYPIDAMEFTPGRKDRQTYAFTGGIAAELTRRWVLGAKMEFESANCAKRKDLRHTNYRLEMTVAPSVLLRTAKGAVGATYIFHKNSERVTAEEIGSSAAALYAFLDKGLGYGAYEVWTGSGVHLHEAGVDGLPLREIRHGAALQASWGGLYVDAEYLCGSGQAGEKQSLWFRFPSHNVTAHAGWRFGSERSLHLVRLKVAWSRQRNFESVLGRESSSGVTTTIVYGETLIFTRERLTVNPEYSWTGLRGEVRGGVEIESVQRLSSLMYPYLTAHSMLRGRLYLRGAFRTARTEIRPHLTLTAGRKSEESRTVTDDLVPGPQPYRLESWQQLQDAWFTATRLDAGLSVRHTFARGIYIEAGAGICCGLQRTLLPGGSRWSETFKIGYIF